MTNKVSKYIEGVGWRYETEHSMTRRMGEHDYRSRCIYMLTLTLADRTTERLGRLSWLTAEHTAENAFFMPSPLGCEVENEWHLLEEEHPKFQIIKLQLMPEHLHVVIFVRENLEKPLGKYVAIVKSRCNKHYWRELTAQGLLGPKGAEAPPPLFADNFTDSILMHEGQLEHMIRYVEHNPYRALVKKANPGLFRTVGELRVKLGEEGERTFAAIGNRWLLDSPLRMQVRCHNNTSDENLRLIAMQKAYLLDRGRKGGVVVSPCISAGEREIARAALDAGVPLIVIQENGFAPLYKPPGKYFEACAKGLLLMLAPWPYHMEKRTISRDQCLALNAMAYELSTEPWTQDLEDRLKG